MSILNKKDVLFERDEEGLIISQKVTLLTNNKEEIMVTPLLRGEIKRIFKDTIGDETTKDTDKEIILNHCKEPIFTEDDIVHMKPYMVTTIVTAILSISGVKEKEKVEKEDLKNS